MPSGQGSEWAKYSKSLTVMVVVEGGEKKTIMDVLKAVKRECGLVLGCRVRGESRLEVTMETVEGKKTLIDGLKVGETTIMGKEMNSDEMVVSFLNLPVYITDDQIIDRLKEWGVGAASGIKRRVWPGTDVVDGTRFLRVKFTEEGIEHFRVIHDRQKRVCRRCIKPGHIYWECPELKCYRCGKMGHFSRECVRGAEEVSLSAKGGGGEEEEVGGDGEMEEATGAAENKAVAGSVKEREPSGLSEDKMEVVAGAEEEAVAGSVKESESSGLSTEKVRKKRIAHKKDVIKKIIFF
ncbi:uncharacterized protein LOC115003706 isoform X1 [Cottoperca gobio]|uniref:Uncharacterized protein LOC115003706 isoform X1 n=1 Tax=Cottoperca gobio TaxID=56716 RepID=A0A6J2P7M0_COTGO|nr:uncharacterized protein LOC115003706 isoform X1 [Cottoperca gobio]